MADIVTTLMRIQDQASGKLKKIGDEAGKTSDKMTDAEKSTALLSKGFAIAGAAALAAGVGFVALAKSVSDYRNLIVDSATRTGLATEQLSALKIAAEGSGLSLEKLVPSLAQFPKRMADFAVGTGEAKVAFEQLGIEVLDGNGKLREASAVMSETLKAVQALPGPTERAALATQLFGKSGGLLLQSLGGTELEDFVRLSELFGTTVGPKAAAASDRWQRSLANLEAAGVGAANKLIEAFGGTDGLVAVFDDLTRLTVFFSTFATERFRTMVEIIGNIAKQIKAAFTFNPREAFEAGSAALRGLQNEAANITEAFLKARDAANEVGKALNELRRAREGFAVGPGVDFGGGAAGARKAAGGPGEATDARFQALLGSFEDTFLDEFDKTTIKQTDSINDNLDQFIALQKELILVEKEGMRQRAVSDISGLAGLAAGDVSGALSLAGPVGAGAGLLAQIGQAGGAEGVEQQLTGFKDAFVEGLQALPEILISVLPEFSLAFEEAMANALVDLPRLFVEAIKRKGEGSVLRGAGQIGLTTLRSSVAIATGGISELALSGLPSRQSGGTTDRTGAYLLHQGEVVFNEQQQKGLMAAVAGGKGPQIINNGVMTGQEAADEIGRLTDKRFDPDFGMGRSVVFGGGT